jgi:hypothetical protein
MGLCLCLGLGRGLGLGLGLGLCLCLCLCLRLCLRLCLCLCLCLCFGSASSSASGSASDFRLPLRNSGFAPPPPLCRRRRKIVGRPRATATTAGTRVVWQRVPAIFKFCKLYIRQKWTWWRWPLFLRYPSIKLSKHASWRIMFVRRCFHVSASTCMEAAGAVTTGRFLNAIGAILHATCEFH